MEDTELIKECRLGNIAAFETLVERHNAKAVRTAYLITGRTDLAEDIAQEAFIQCYYSIKKLKKPEYFSTWFYKILFRTGCRMAVKNKPVLSLDTNERINSSIDPGEMNISEYYEEKEKGEAVFKIVSSLTKPLREVIVLYYYNDFSIRQIAEILNCREGTVKSRLSNARNKIAGELEKQEKKMCLTMTEKVFI